MNEQRLLQRLRNTEHLLDNYHTDEPFSRFLSRFFKENRQMGSGDRRAATHLSYHLFRLGDAAADTPRRDRMAMAELLCTPGGEWLALLKPEWAFLADRSLEERIAFLEKHTDFRLQDVFPLHREVSPAIDTPAFIRSFFVQPQLFIRIHTGKEKAVTSLLDDAGISYKTFTRQTLALENGAPLDQVKKLRGLYEVQDLSSQQTVSFFCARAGESWWDACAASGGKSILLKQTEPAVNLLVSDIRQSILRNLDERFEMAGIRHYRRKIIDLTGDPSVILGNEQFDGIIVDAPCTGSGTWGRAPEMLSQVGEGGIARYVLLQRQITANVIKHLKTGCPLVYITCSVFQAENEATVTFLEQLGLRTEQTAYLQGYKDQADTLFAARLIKP